MGNIKRLPLIAMIIMVILSFTNLFGLNIAGASVILGVVFFFINKASEKQAFSGSGLDIKAIGKNLKDKKIWIWILLPLIMDIVSMTIGKLFLPGYIEHVLARSGNIVTFDKVALLVPELAFLALGEEIAWRAFFQKQLNKALPIVPVLLISSVLFGMGHLAAGSVIIVIFDIFFVFINSILYGVVFYKTNNAWVSTISHFIANLFSVIVLIFF
jgi:membrane protease YdiL (CAAX protease family)